MKTTSNRLILVTLAATLLVPSLALAEGSGAIHGAPVGQVSPAPQPTQSPRLAETPKIDPAQLCAKIGDLTSSVNGETNDRFSTLAANFDKRNAGVASKFADAATKITAQRATIDAQRQENFKRLEAKATTDAQKQAVATFEAAVLKAVAARRSAVDAADASFKVSVTAALNQRQTQLKAAATTYKVAVAAAIASAKASCAAGTKPSVVRQTLQAALKTARTNLQAAIQAADKVHPNLDPFKATHKAAIDKADADFKAAIDAALSTLKATLQAAKPSPSTSPAGH